ncbi:MAG: hypothetical protein IKP97_06640 [Kiritimatiellae bacterium]|nr:hypothetical protein [Kiritimatiellia bacterium]
MKSIIDRIFSIKALLSLLLVFAAGGAWAVAPTPTVVWESDFGTATKTGTDGNSYTITLNDNTVNSEGNIEIASSATKGAIIDTSAASASSMTVLVRYKSAPAASASVVPISMYCYRTSGSVPDVGMVTYRANSYQNYACWYVQSGSREFNSTDGTDPVMSASGGHLMLSYDCSTLRVYAGNTIATLAGGAKAYAWGSSKMNYVGLGGPTGKTNGLQWNAWGGMVIEKVAIFPGNAYTNTDLADYVWPSAEKYQKWSYADTSRIVTWTTPSYAIDNCIPAPAASYTVFDLTSGSNTSTTYTGGAASSTTGANWHYFCYSSNAGSEYVAPGSVLRFVSGDYKKSLAADYSPVTYGGIIVEEGATGYAFASASRYSVLGDPTGATETWFEFNEDFTFGRSGGCHLTGTVNLDIASGKTFTIAGTTTNTATTAKSNILSGTAGGTLKLHGSGKLAATLNASSAKLDFSDQPTASADTTAAYIQGALTVDANTTFEFPQGATFPYFVATSISGDVDHSTGYKANADGSISQVTPTVLSITSTDAVDLPTTWTSADDAVVYVVDGIDATLNVTAAATLSSIMFYVPMTSTLTISGEAITATTLNFPQPGVVKVTSSGALVGTATGSGTLQYTGVLPTITSGISFSNAAWTGTMWLKDFGELSGRKVNSNLTAGMASWGNTGSKVKFTNVKAYAPSYNVTCNYTLVLEDGTGSEEYAWRCDNGYSNNTVSFGGLAGTGTFYDQGDVTSKFTFNSFDGFTGKFNIASSGHQIAMPASATLNVTQNSSIKFASQGMLGTLNIPAGVTLTSTGSDALGYNATGTVNVYGTLAMGATRWTCGSNNYINLYEGASITGTGDTSHSATIDMNIANGTTVYAYGNATIACPIRSNAGANGKIVVDSDKTLTVSGRIFGDYQTKKQGEGTLLYTYTGDNYVLPVIEAGAFELGGSRTWDLGTLRDFSGLTLESGSSIAIDQTQVEYATGTTTVDNIDSSIASITVNKADGTTATLTRTDSTSTLVESVVVSGAACWYDFTFTNTITTASGSSAGTVTLGKDAGPAYGTLTDAAKNTYSGLYAYCRPYTDINLGSTTQFTVALYGTMPTADNTILLDCGGCGSAGALLLASGSSANEAKLYYYNSSGLTPLATMAATSCRTTPHLYVFEKISDHQVNIYLDGKLALAYVNNDISFTLTAGFQVASGYAAVPSGLNAIANTATTDTTIIAMTRIYDRIISDAEMAVLKTEWPYFSPNGDSARTLVSGETAADWTETGKWTVNNAEADTPLANSVVTLTNSAEADAIVSVNLDGNTEYESVTFAGDAAISVALKSGYTGKIVPASTSFETDTTVAYNAMNLTEGAVEVAAGKTLTFDVSSLVDANWANVASIASIQLTGVATLGTESSIAVTPTTSGYWNLAAEADAGGNYYLTFTPNRETGSIYWQSGTYWNSTYQSGDSPAVFTTDAEGQNATKYFAGDTVIIPNKTHRYFGPISDGAIIQFDCGETIDISKTDSLGYALKNATVTVASGTTLNFVNSWNETPPEVYGGTISGAGKVQVASGITLKLSNGATINAATALTGAGTVNLASVPTAQMTFDDNWTGTVKLPQFAAAATKLNFAGNASSTVALAGITSGWLGETSTQRSDVAPTLRLDGDVTISGMSTSWQYSFAKITGTGNLSFTSANAPASLAITEIADYTGTLNNSTTTALTVGRISLASAPEAGDKLVATSTPTYVNIASGEGQGVYVGDTKQDVILEKKSDGIYVAATAETETVGEDTVTVLDTGSNTAVDASSLSGKVAIPGTIANISGVAEENLLLKVEYNNGSAQTAYYGGILSVANDGSVSLNGSATVDGVKVEPEVNTASSPMTLSGDTPNFTVKTIPGLYYTVLTSDSATSGFDAAGDAVLATGTSTELNTGDDSWGENENVKYYKISVGRTAAEAQQ